MMKIQIRERNNKVDEALRAHAQRRLGFALGRFGEQVGQVMVRFSDILGRKAASHRKTDGKANGRKANGRKANGRMRNRPVDKLCQIVVTLRPRSVRVEDTDADAFAALDYAADRAGRSVARTLDLERAWGADVLMPRDSKM